jgi:hypothetical protein
MHLYDRTVGEYGSKTPHKEEGKPIGSDMLLKKGACSTGRSGT